jgi:hypothetical protein
VTHDIKGMRDKNYMMISQMQKKHLKKMCHPLMLKTVKTRYKRMHHNTLKAIL